MLVSRTGACSQKACVPVPQVATQGRATKASDVFSFGIIMCEVCSRIPPWMRQGSDCVLNPAFPTFAPSTPEIYKQLAWRCARAHTHTFFTRARDLLAARLEVCTHSDHVQQLRGPHARPSTCTHTHIHTHIHSHAHIHSHTHIRVCADARTRILHTRIDTRTQS